MRANFITRIMLRDTKVSLSCIKSDLFALDIASTLCCFHNWSLITMQDKETYEGNFNYKHGVEGHKNVPQLHGISLHCP